MTKLAAVFPSYTEFEPKVSVRRVSQPGRPTIHRFYDTSPISPSGRFIALTEFDYDDRLPAAGDEASVVVIDLGTGAELYRTRTTAWDTQLGAQVQWGASDKHLYFNRMSPDWKPFGVDVDPRSGEEKVLQGTVYMVSPDGRTAVSPNLIRIARVQEGYGVIVPPELRRESVGAPEDDGLFVVDLESGASRLAVSFREIYEALPAAFKGIGLASGGFYGFHAKWSPDGKRIFFIVRWQSRFARKGHSKNWIVTMNADFSDLKVALTPERWAGGHHPNWCPDSEHIIMNLVFPNRRLRFSRLWRLADRVAAKAKVPGYRKSHTLRFAQFRYDGGGLHAIAPTQVGSGHPTFNETASSVLTDAYPWEQVAMGDGTSPIRFVSVTDDTAESLVRIRTAPDFLGPRREWRVDPHPAWSRDGGRFVFNGCPGGDRGVFIAEMSKRS